MNCYITNELFFSLMSFFLISKIAKIIFITFPSLPDPHRNSFSATQTQEQDEGDLFLPH